MHNAFLYYYSEKHQHILTSYGQPEKSIKNEKWRSSTPRHFSAGIQAKQVFIPQQPSARPFRAQTTINFE
jgi:hypothetical protein